MNTPVPLQIANQSSSMLAGEQRPDLLFLFALSEKVFDFTAVTLAIYTANAVCPALAPGGAVTYSPSMFWLAATGFALLFVFQLERHGGYRPCVSLLAIRETERVLRVTLQSFSIALVAAYLAHA